MKTIATLILMTLALTATAQQREPDMSAFRTVAELRAEGYTPFAISDVANASFGMQGEGGLYMCFLIDTPALAQQRQTVIKLWLEGLVEDRELPNVPLVCTLMQ